MSHNNSFLKSIAKSFCNENTNLLKEYCFIFPNRRSCTFFEKELVSCSKEAFVLPKITTISDFLCDTTKTFEPNRIEMMLDLYDVYCSIAGDNAESFDEFSYWGDIIIGDFNDVDLYMVDAEKLFTNIKDFKEIGTDYLTIEQKEVLKQYFGDSYQLSDHSIDSFWKHSNAFKDGDTTEYFYLWEILGKLYKQFNEKLADKGVAYTGQIYRKAVEKIKKMSADDFEFKQYIFVGFNVLSTSEYLIFDNLNTKNIADFYWDFNSPALNDTNNKANKFISKYIKKFKSKLNIEEAPIETFPNIEALAIPSNVGQVKYATHIIDKLIAENKANKNNMLDTAIVLPDENLFIPLSGSIDSEKISNVNITMGFPVKKSLVASLLSTISRTQRQSRKIKDEYCYYIEDIKSILSHPYIKLITNDEIINLQQYLSNNRLYFIPVSILEKYCKSLVNLFTPITKLEVEELIDYTKRILDFISIKIVPILNKETGSIELSCINKYIEQFNQLANIIGKYKIQLNENTFFFLIDKFISGAIISLQGEPLNGLQIMGVLETRCLDFKNLIVLSMNERVFPRKHFSRSFIPYTIRKGFGMATIEHQECMYAYYFYRMISRAENVYLLYDARTTGLGSGDPSRYIQQLCKVYTESKTKIKHISFDISSTKELEIQVPKTAQIMEKLNVYRDRNSNKYLSASAINTYLACPLKFYFEKVEGLYINDEITEFMNASTIGTVIHDIMLQIYSKSSLKIITKDYIKKYIENKGFILDKVIKEVIDKVVYHKKESSTKNDENFELEGEAFMLQDAIKHYIIQILEYDSKQEFEFIQGEVEEKKYWEDLGINFKQFIDRVDRIAINDNESLFRIIDYKTGADQTTIDKFDSIITNSDKKAIAQVLLYCCFYNYYHNTNEKIQPMIYTVRDINKSEIKVGKETLTDYTKYSEEFMTMIKNKIDELFDENIPFTQATKDTACTFCKFKDFCRTS